MYLETYPKTVNVGRQWRQIDGVVYSNFPQNDFSFLYIGNHGGEQYFSTFFQSGIFTDDYIQAQLLIEKFNWNNIPDVIFVDLPLRKTEFLNFHSFLKEKGFLSQMVVIYNEKELDFASIKFLKQRELVDDVVHIDSRSINYSKKISFLKKLKMNQDNLISDKTKPFRFQSVSLKRVIDIVGSLIAIVLIAPLFILIALAVKLESRGPVIYTSLRAGKGFKIFKFYKFRTMGAGADQKIEELAHLNQYEENENGAKFLKIENDPRVTKLGKILRKTSLDELPQFFNVLKGNMSLVGNRPLPLYEASTLTTNEFVERFMAPAGITGLWQIKKRGKTQMSTEERISLDILYARTANPLLDLWIMARTPSALFQKSNG